MFKVLVLQALYKRPDSCGPKSTEKGIKTSPDRSTAESQPVQSRIQARVEHVFGHQVTAMGGKLVRFA
jgi:hypothetical protein